MAIYFSEDSNNRKRYFEKQFLKNANIEARNRQITLNNFLGQIKDLESFKRVLKASWSNDPSLHSYFDGMDTEDLLTFFERPLIQNILTEGKEVELGIPPAFVEQEDKKVRLYFIGKIKGKKVIARKTWVIIKNKRYARYIDNKGRFASIDKI